MRGWVSTVGVLFAVKLQQFLDEVNRLSEHYQYQLQAQLNYTSQGILPKLVVINVPPKVKNKK